MTERKQLGDFGERVAAHRLESLGLTILRRNVRVGRIEVDLLAQDGDTLVFVEVRTRRGLPGAAAESLDPAKLQRMWQAAIAYCDQNGHDPDLARIDVVTIEPASGNRALSVEHYPGIEVPVEE